MAQTALPELPPREVSTGIRRILPTALKFFRSHRVAAFGAMILLLYLVLAAFAPLIAPYQYQEQGVGEILAAPSSQHLFGTDEFGRDVFSRVVHGSRISLRIGFIVVFVAGVGGSLIGLFSAIRGGWVDELIMRISDIFLAVPDLILAIAIATALGPSINNAIIGIALVRWTHYARLMRSRVLVEKQKEYVLAARAMGATQRRIMYVYIFPNSFSPVLVQATLDFGWAILVAAGLSFVGAGAQPPLPEWGALVASGRTYVTSAWWIATFPGLAILGVVLASNLVGDALRDATDPRLNHESGK